MRFDSIENMDKTALELLLELGLRVEVNESPVIVQVFDGTQIVVIGHGQTLDQVLEECLAAVMDDVECTLEVAQESPEVWTSVVGED